MLRFKFLPRAQFNLASSTAFFSSSPNEQFSTIHGEKIIFCSWVFLFFYGTRNLTYFSVDSHSPFFPFFNAAAIARACVEWILNVDNNNASCCRCSAFAKTKSLHSGLAHSKIPFSLALLPLSLSLLIISIILIEFNWLLTHIRHHHRLCGKMWVEHAPGTTVGKHFCKPFQKTSKSLFFVSKF